VPTTRKRHMVTETDEVGAALARVRAADPNGKVNLAELVVLGAERKLEQLQTSPEIEAHQLALRERFLERSRTGEGIDWEAAIYAHEHGWGDRGDV
jgi:hypothetical protein